ncbi:phosphoglycerate dehydrogenase [Amycolatopsis antarctica]|uniref:Phosphoglycerate dehydrogenase n=1 Tax=Amycolatopsis antarctica TaxID=1854586 RepID=A0A263D9P5_9PSEU|nr:2-hydroxyacid dehydrogenase [Amycolatopsis antarctica]OZM74196.1 phosphoglycerate dehydrogenase [Amycolatopsis antarctica]
MAVTVLVPDEEGVTALSAVEGVRVVRYDRDAPLPPEAEEAEVVVPKLPAGTAPGEFVRRFPGVKLVQLLSAGAEEWAGTLPEGVLLSTCRGAHGGSTAEWVMAVLLSEIRELPAFAEAARRSQWDRRDTGTVQGMRVLVVGAGDLGNSLRRRLEPFDARVTMVGMTSRDGVHGVGELPDLLPEADVVALMVPLTSRTRGMVDAGFLAAMPAGAMLVNASRGPVVDTGALLAEVRTGRLRAALDVTDPEPLPPGHPLWTVPGVVITPHVAGAAHGVRRRSYAVVAAEIERYVNGELPDNLVHGEY